MKHKIKAFFVLLTSGIMLGVLRPALFRSTAVHAQKDFSVVMITGDPNEPGASYIIDGWEDY